LTPFGSQKGGKKSKNESKKEVLFGTPLWAPSWEHLGTILGAFGRILEGFWKPFGSILGAPKPLGLSKTKTKR
jgi:hypothetical protein